MPSSTTTTTTTTSKRHAAPWSAFDKVFNDAFSESKRRSSHRRRASSSSDHDPSNFSFGRSSSPPPPIPQPTSQPTPTVPRRERGYKLASERRRTSVKDVPSGQWKDIPGGTGEWNNAHHDWDEERSKEQTFATNYGEEAVPQFEQRERKAVRKTTTESISSGGPLPHASGKGSAGPTPQKPGHRRNESWSSMSSAGEVKPRKPRVTFTDSADGRMRAARFELPNIAKEDINVSFQVDQIVVTWQTVKETEEQIGDQLIRERKEKKYTRSLPLSSGADFSQVKATMEGPFLTLHYPTASRNRSHKDVRIH